MSRLLRQLACWLTVSLGCLLSAMPGSAQSFRARPAPLAQLMATDAALHALAMVNDQIGWAVGDRGVILHTDSGGRRWLPQSSPVDTPLRGVWFTDPQHGWVVGSEAVPYSPQSQSVVLRTTDGGYSWQRLATPLLPGLSGVRFLDTQRGFVWGHSNALSPAGVYRTRDGGAHWEPVHADTACQWTAAAMATPQSALLVGPRGRIATYESGAVEPLLATGNQRLTCLSLNADGSGWIGSAAGELLTTADAGQRWKPASGPAGFAIASLAHHQSRLWAVGPSSGEVATSTNAGQSWRKQPTGTSMPLNAVQFIDGKQGWAVGELGTIVATTNAGQTWQVQRQSGQRCAALVICGHPEEAPLEMIAKLGAAEGYLTGVLAMLSDPRDQGDQQERFLQASVAAGATYARVLDGFALLPSQQEASVTAVAAVLGTDATERMAQAILQQIRLLRPSAVLVATSESHAAGGMVETAALQASRLASESGAGPRRVLRIVPNPPPATPGVTTADFEPALNTSLQHWTAGSREVLTARPTAAPQRIGWTALSGVSPNSDRGDALAGLVVERAAGARRDYARPPTDTLATLKAIAAKRQHREQLLTARHGDAAWAQQVLQLTGGLSPTASARLLVELAAQYRQQGQMQLAADTAYLQARRYPTLPLSQHTLDDLVRYYSSSEAALAHQQTHSSDPTNESLTDSPDKLTLAEHSDRALKLGDYLSQAAPHRHAQPGLRLMLAAAARQTDKPLVSETLLAPLGTSATPRAWQQCASAEQWLTTREGSSPKPVLHGQPTAQRPLLDGKLKEPIWQAAAAIDITQGSAHDNSLSAAQLQVAFDEQFLYLAIRCQKLPAGAYPSDRMPRSRDADLRGYDRMTLRLDTNRDYASAFELTLDCRGWTHDACDGAVSWNPTYFVAAGQTEDSWTVEAAIALKQLSLPAAAKDQAWALSVERQAPGRLPVTWTGASYADNRPESFGLLLFE